MNGALTTTEGSGGRADGTRPAEGARTVLDWRLALSSGEEGDLELCVKVSQLAW